MNRSNQKQHVIRRRVVLSAALSAALGSAGLVHANTKYPSGPISVVVGGPPGSLSDTLSRFFALKLSEALSEKVFVENKPGANGMLAAGAVAKAAPDGRSLFLTPDTVMVVNQFVYQRSPYNVETDFQPIALLGKVSVVLVTHPKSGIKTLDQLVQRAKSKPQSVTYASGGSAHPTHLIMAMTANRLGLQMTHVPYKGTSPGLQGVMAGDVDAMVIGSAEAVPLIESGRLVLLAASGPGAKERFPTVPLLRDAHRDLDLTSWFAIFGPAGLPPETVSTLNTELNKVLRSPEAKARLAEFHMLPLPGAPDEVQKMMQAERLKYRELVEAIGLKVD